MVVEQQPYGVDGSSSRATLTLAAILISLAFAARPVVAGSPPLPAGCPATDASFENTTAQAISDLTTTTSTITVSGMDTYLWDVDLTTHIRHAVCRDLDITLTSPEGTVVTITTDNGSNLENVFDGTLWDDDAGDTNAPGTVTGTSFANGVTETPLCPEEALGAFIGEDPNGVWTLDVYDDMNDNHGSLDGWSLDLTTLLHAPTKTTTSFSDSPNLSIPDFGTLTATISVSGLDTLASDVNLWTEIEHVWCRDLHITLTSPQGTVVTITTDNGSNLENVFDGTLWDDDAGDTNAPGPVTDTSFADGVAETPLCPEGAMAAFIGEDPNGTWTLTVTDNVNGDTGTFNTWSLEITTCEYPDSDDDGVVDCIDNCPNDANKLDPAACGCGVADTDTDGDGVADCVDNCPNDANKLDPGACGCGVADEDLDNDGVPDCLDIDLCPDDPYKTLPGACGCDVPDEDLNNDGIPDCLDFDLCPDDPYKTVPGVCGCGVADTDSDGDGIPDCLEPGGQENPQPSDGNWLFWPFSFCGTGTAACLPLMIAGLGLMRHRVRRRHLK